MAAKRRARTSESSAVAIGEEGPIGGVFRLWGDLSTHLSSPAENSFFFSIFSWNYSNFFWSCPKNSKMTVQISPELLSYTTNYLCGKNCSPAIENGERKCEKSISIMNRIFDSWSNDFRLTKLGEKFAECGWKEVKFVDCRRLPFLSGCGIVVEFANIFRRRCNLFKIYRTWSINGGYFVQLGVKSVFWTTKKESKTS